MTFQKLLNLLTLLIFSAVFLMSAIVLLQTVSDSGVVESNITVSSAQKLLLVPTPQSQVPPPFTHTVPLTTVISIGYSENISLATVSSQTFAIHAMQTGLLTGTYGVTGGTIEFTPAKPLKPGELVQVSATTHTLNLSSIGPISSTVWQFRGAIAGSTGILTNTGPKLGDADSRSVAIGDVDGDGDLDAFVGNIGSNKLWTNNETGVFTDNNHSLGGFNSFALALGDVDNDGDLDALVGNSASHPNQVWLNNGIGNFSDSNQTLGISNTNSIALGDVDGDADLDAFIGNSDEQANTIWLNDGTGVFTDSHQSLGNSSSRAVALGDVDGDGDLDAFVVNSGTNAANKVWLNNGAGIFSDSGQSLGDSWSVAVALGDLDNDGDLDALVGNSGPDQVWFNQGNGTFIKSSKSMGAANTVAVALGDVDDDGDLDVFVGDGGNVPDKVWLNDGDGIFADSGQRLGNSSTGAVAVGDLDNDGDLDAFVAGSNDQANTVYLNQPHLNYLPLILKPGTELFVFNDNTGGDVTFTVRDLGTDSVVINCTVPNNQTLLCGTFSPGTYKVVAVATCGTSSTTKTYAAGPQTTRVFCQ